MNAKGYVTLVSNRPFNGTMLYSFRVSTEDKYFRTGSIDPNISKNDFIQFDYVEKNGNYSVVLPSLKHVAREESSPAPSASGGTGSARGVVGRDDYWANKEARDVEKDKVWEATNLRIQYQSARNAAISVVDILVRDKILKLSDAAKADNVAVVLGKIDDLTDAFFAKCGAIGVGNLGNDSGSAGDKDSLDDSATWK